MFTSSLAVVKLTHDRNCAKQFVKPQTKFLPNFVNPKPSIVVIIRANEVFVLFY